MDGAVEHQEAAIWHGNSTAKAPAEVNLTPPRSQSSRGRPQRQARWPPNLRRGRHCSDPHARSPLERAWNDDRETSRVGCSQDRLTPRTDPMRPGGRREKSLLVSLSQRIVLLYSPPGCTASHLFESTASCQLFTPTTTFLARYHSLADTPPSRWFSPITPTCS